MRTMAGLVVVQDGLTYLPEGHGPAAWPVAVILLAAGSLLVVGLLTPFAATAAILIEGALGRGLLVTSAPGMHHTTALLVLLETILIALLLQGPGAFSLDSRIFGRREIIIPFRGE